MGNRRRARELALQTLYAIDANDGGMDEALVHMKTWATEGSEVEGEDIGEGVGPDVEEFAEELVRGVIANIESIDTLLGECSTNWKVPRMALVDRNVLRLATFELQHLRDIPPKVTLNEAIEIAKRYGAGDSSAFINGVLDRIASMERKNQ